MELDSLLNREVEQQWAKRMAQWCTEREARRKLMDDVMKTRRQQVQEKSKKPLMCTPVKLLNPDFTKVAALEEEKRAAMIEREALIANYQKHMQIEKEQQEDKKKVEIDHHTYMYIHMCVYNSYSSE